MSRQAGATSRPEVTATVAEQYHRMTGPLVRAASAWPPRRSRPLLLVGGRALDLGGGQPGSRATASGPMLVPVAELSAADTIPILRAGVGDAYSGPPGRGGPGHLRGPHRRSARRPRVRLLLTRPGGHKQTRRVKPALAAQQPM